MGSPVSAVIANLYLEVFEEQTIEFVSNNPKHSVYDTFTTHLKLKCRITQKNSVKFLPAAAAFFGGVFLHTVGRCSLTLERMVFLHA